MHQSKLTDAHKITEEDDLQTEDEESEKELGMLGIYPFLHMN